MNECTRLFDFLDYQWQHFPKQDMLSGKKDHSWEKFSTKDVIQQVNTISRGLLMLGLGNKPLQVEHQDKIAIISRNRPEWILLDLACQQIGVILCPIYPTTHINEIEFIFNDAQIKYVFISGEEIADKLISIQPHIPSLKAIYSFDTLEGTKHWNSLFENDNQNSSISLEEIKKSILPEHCATIIYTSGTTGTPKGVMLSHKNIVSNVIHAKNSFPFPAMPNARALSFLPLNHIFERLASYIYISSGISIYYAESMDSIGDNIREVKPHLFTTVPRLLEKVFEKIMLKGSELSGIKRTLFYWAVELAEQFDNIEDKGFLYNTQLFIANKLVFRKWRQALGNHVKFIITGGAACQPKLLRIFNAARIPVYEGYGPTENSPVISVNCHKKGGTKFGTVGIVIDGQEVKIEDDGEICVKGPSVMMGYYNRPDLTQEAIKEGWLHTGDIGFFEDGKYLRITDRKKELFKTSGGKYVAPQAIENKVKESEYIEHIMVVGADKKYVAALIVPSFTSLKKWMINNNIPYTSDQDATDHPEILQFYLGLIQKFNTNFNQVEQIKKFELIANEWSVDSGELTPKLSMKRKVIMEKYNNRIDKLFQ